ncbi:MAG: MarR family transcriptional regulator [Clostridia bacterium]|nr:MarR family transcriptional regulator [Clostridia bacterium]
MKLRYLVMVNHLIMKKNFFARVQDTTLTLGQPKVIDYLRDNDGSVQKDIANACCIEPASLTVVLNLMERQGLIEKRMCNNNRKNLHIYLTDKGRELSDRIEEEFLEVEKIMTEDFTKKEKEMFLASLEKVRKNLIEHNI